MSDSLLIIDGNSMLNRSFYGIRSLSNSKGLPTNALFGFANILKKHLDDICPSHAVCAFDLKAPTFRHRMYDGYKSTRHPMPQELALQIPYAHQLAEGIGFHVVTKEGFEADDILGTLASLAARQGKHAYIVSGDRDLLQLVSPNITVIHINTKGDVYYTPELFLKEKGVKAEEYVDVKALMGDSSDNIPGASGIGEKTAFQLIAQYHSVNYIYEHIESLDLPLKQKEKLIASHEQVKMSYDLSKIMTEVPLDLTLEDVTYNHPNLSILTPLFTELEFTSMLNRYQCETSSESCKIMHQDIKIKMIPIDSLPVSDTYYLKVSLLDEKNYQLDIYLTPYIYRISCSDDVLSSFLSTHAYVTHDCKSIFRNMGDRIKTNQCVFDTMLASWLIDPGKGNYPLDSLIQRYLGISPDHCSAEYSAFYIHELSRILREKIDESRMDSILKEIEIPLAYVLASMEKEGFRLDTTGLHSYVLELQRQADQLEKAIYEKAGCEFNIKSPKQLSSVLFDQLALSEVLPAKTKKSTDADTLQMLLPFHPIIQVILDYRTYSKLLGTYGDNLIEMVDNQSCIHTTFNQTGTATGRLSSLDPNLQNIPTRGDIGKEIRRFFTAKSKDRILIDADYSQIELRLLAALSMDETMIDAFNQGFDIHASTASKIFHIPMSEMTSSVRSKAKAINFGIVYGMGPHSLSQDLKISMKEAKEYIASYLSTYPKVESFLQNCKDQAHENAYVSTAFGRRRPLQEINSSNKMIQAATERIAMNSPIQGTAADIIKLAMIRVFQDLKKANIDAKLILQVHDELILDCSINCKNEAESILKSSMESVFCSPVKLDVSLSDGFTWFDAK